MCRDCVRVCERPKPLSWVAGGLRWLIVVLTVVTVAPVFFEYWTINQNGWVGSISQHPDLNNRGGAYEAFAKPPTTTLELCRSANVNPETGALIYPRNLFIEYLNSLQSNDTFACSNFVTKKSEYPEYREDEFQRCCAAQNCLLDSAGPPSQLCCGGECLMKWKVFSVSASENLLTTDPLLYSIGTRLGSSDALIAAKTEVKDVLIVGLLFSILAFLFGDLPVEFCRCRLAPTIVFHAFHNYVLSGSALICYIVAAVDCYKMKHIFAVNLDPGPLSILVFVLAALAVTHVAVTTVNLGVFVIPRNRQTLRIIKMRYQSKFMAEFLKDKYFPSGDSLPQNIFDYFDGSRLLDRESWEERGRVAFKALKPGKKDFRQVEAFLYDKMDGARSRAEGSPVKEIFEVFNTDLAANFLTQIKTVSQRIESDPNIFAKNSWQNDSKPDLRKWVMQSFLKRSKAFPWNVGISEKTLPIWAVVHGTSEKAAWKIVQNGFSNISLLDAGFYGRGLKRDVGIYFTSSGKYALPYYSTRKDPALLICLLLPGNPYPVVESPKGGSSPTLNGTPLKPGYQSHYVLTTKDGMPCEKVSDSDVYDEVVIDQESQVLPIYLITFDGDKLADIAIKFNRVLPPNSKDPIKNNNSANGNQNGSQDVAPASSIRREVVVDQDALKAAKGEAVETAAPSPQSDQEKVNVADEKADEKSVSKSHSESESKSKSKSARSKESSSEGQDDSEESGDVSEKELAEVSRNPSESLSKNPSSASSSSSTSSSQSSRS